MQIAGIQLPMWTSVAVGVALAAVAVFLIARWKLKAGPDSKGNVGQAMVSTLGDAVETPCALSQLAVPMVSYGEIQAKYDRLHSEWSTRSAENEAAIRHLMQSTYESWSPATLLDEASEEEVGNLAAILAVTRPVSASGLEYALLKAGSHSVASIVRGSHIGYREVVADVIVKLGQPKPVEGTSVADLEKQAIGVALQLALDKATPEQRRAILAELGRGQTGSNVVFATATGGLVVAQLSGFGLYLGASTALGLVSGALGVVLPFAVYTTMSSLLAVVTGPVGWLALAGWAVVKFGGTDYKKTVPGVFAVTALRGRLIGERDASVASLQALRTGRLASERASLDAMKNFLEEMKRDGREQVPKDHVPWV
jgi:uncharacterized protein YaaW (UPF0174 family)